MQKTSYEMRISDWSSDVCPSDLLHRIADIDTKIAELKSIRHTLTDLARRCHGDDRPDCPILEHLAHGKSAPARGVARASRVLASRPIPSAAASCQHADDPPPGPDAGPGQPGVGERASSLPRSTPPPGRTARAPTHAV